MIEAEWLTANNPAPMLEFVKATASERKLRLFACACCRRIWPALKRRGSRNVVEICEMHADNLASSEKLSQAHRNANDAFARIQWTAEGDAETTPARATIYLGAGSDFYPHRVAGEAAAAFGVKIRERDFRRRKQSAHNKGQDEPVWEQHNAIYLSAEAEEERTQSRLLRCIFGNPFRSVVLDPRWQTETVLTLATGIYEERAFDRMPILADALEEAGCDHADILTHCRGDGLHVRGCWVVDLVLGKV